MILLTKKWNYLNKQNSGFSLLEIIVTITIIGIFTSTMIPTYNYMFNKKEELEVEKTVMILENDFRKKLSVSQSNNSPLKYPIESVSSTNDIGYLNIPDKEFYYFCQTLINFSNGIDSKIKEYKVSSTSFQYNKCKTNVVISFESNEKIDFEFIVFDNQINYMDYAYLEKFTYYNKNNLSKTIDF